MRDLRRVGTRAHHVRRPGILDGGHECPPYLSFFA